MSDEELAKAIDPLVESLDINKDGFIDYGEYKLATSGDKKNNWTMNIPYFVFFSLMFTAKTVLQSGYVIQTLFWVVQIKYILNL